MRLFVAIVPPGPALADLAAAVAPLQTTAPQLRWTRPEAWHLTLAFLGDVAERRQSDLEVRLERAARRHPPQVLAIAGAGAFPGPARATVLWAGFHADRQGLRRLADSVAAGARRAGAPPPDEGRRYRPHLTLARSRSPADVSSLVAALSELAGPAWTAGEIALVRSEPVAGQGQRYDVMARWPLAGSATPTATRAGQAMAAMAAIPATPAALAMPIATASRQRG